jgi:serine/threonine protein kinase
MLTKSGAKLLDFGLAKLKTPTEEATGLSLLATQEPATAQGIVLGTVPYMAPEQLEGKATDART